MPVISIAILVTDMTRPTRPIYPSTGALDRSKKSTRPGKIPILSCIGSSAGPVYFEPVKIWNCPSRHSNILDAKVTVI